MPSPQAQYDAQHAEPNSGPALREFRDLEQARANYTAMMTWLGTLDPEIAEFTSRDVRMVDGMPRVSLSVELTIPGDGTPHQLLGSIARALLEVYTCTRNRETEAIYQWARDIGRRKDQLNGK